MSKSYIPLLDVSTPSLSLTGQILSRPGNAPRRPMKSIEKNHLEHTHWCRIKQGNCTCLLHNRFKPAKVNVRVECTRAHLQPILDFATDMEMQGNRDISNAILDCIEPQTRIEPQKRAFTFAYPILDTRWNHGLGDQSIVRVRTPKEAETGDASLVEQMDAMRMKRLEIESQQRVKVFTAKNEFFENEYHAMFEWKGPIEEELEDDGSGPGLITLSKPLLFEQAKELTQIDQVPAKVENNDYMSPEEPVDLAPPKQAEPVEEATTRKTTPMIVALPELPPLTTEISARPLTVPEQRIILGIQTVPVKIKQPYSPILKPIKSTIKYKKPMIRKYPYEGRPIFPSQNQFGLSNKRTEKVFISTPGSTTQL